MTKDELLGWFGEVAALSWNVTVIVGGYRAVDSERWEEAKNQIRALIEGKPMVSREFVQKWADILAPIRPKTNMGTWEQMAKMRADYILKMLREAGMEVRG